MAACNVSTSGVNFGSYDVFNTTPTESLGSIDVSCSEQSNITVQLSLGPSSVSGAFAPRQMRELSGSDRLDYNFYSKGNYHDVWGDGTGGSVNQIRNVSNRRPWNEIIYGLIPAQQNVAAGSYGDSLVISIMF